MKKIKLQNKQQLQHMEDFKAFAEQGTDVRDHGA